MKHLLTTLIFLGMTGCSTIYFQRDAQTTSTQYEEWHHDGILGLVEFSDPVDMNQRCNGSSWKTIKTEETFVQGLVRGVTWSLYDPWMVSYSCNKTASNAVPASPGKTAPAKAKTKKKKANS